MKLSVPHGHSCKFPVTVMKGAWRLSHLNSGSPGLLIRHRKEAKGRLQHEGTKHQDTRLPCGPAQRAVPGLLAVVPEDISFHFLFTFYGLGAHLYPY